ncbi:MAG: inositol monophosphatase family protein [archaeon]|nr:inositol monophosphatase family protein [archaeon]
MSAAGSGTITSALRLTQSACEVLAPLVRKIYLRIDDSTRMEKKDSSLFSLADGLVQHAFFEWFFRQQVAHLVGEESAAVNLETPPFSVGKLEIPSDLMPDIQSAKSRILSLSGQLAALPSLSAAADSVFLDPIDGTREFCTGLGHQSTICVGFAREGAVLGGVVFRPIPEPPTWAVGCRQEGFFQASLAPAQEGPSGKQGLLTTNGSVSPFLATLMQELGYQRVPSGGAGNKMLMLLEGHGSLYLQDRGLSRWDTCAAQAVLEAQQGFLKKLSPFVADGSLQDYTYRQTPSNLDLIPGQARITPYNRASKDSAPGTPIDSPSQVLPYSNLAGLLAVSAAHSSPAALLHLSESIRKVIQAGHLPSYD